MCYRKDKRESVNICRVERKVWAKLLIGVCRTKKENQSNSYSDSDSNKERKNVDEELAMMN